jgi:hypothetical protein
VQETEILEIRCCDYVIQQVTCVRTIIVVKGELKEEIETKKVEMKKQTEHQRNVDSKFYIV